MPDWLFDAVQNNEQLPIKLIGSRVGLSLLLGFVVAGIYSATRERHNGEGRSMPATLALLSVLIALVTLVIGNSVARAFGLVGALSIVRFRTVVDDTRDTAFVIFAVVIGMGCGAGYALIALVGIPAVALTAFVMGRRIVPDSLTMAVLTIRVALGVDPASTLNSVFSKYLNQSRIIATATAKQGAALELIYAIRLKKMSIPRLRSSQN